MIFKNCYYLLYTGKKVPNFNNWKKSARDKIEKNSNSFDAKIFKIGLDENSQFGGIYLIDQENRSKSLGITFNSFVEPFK